MSSKEVKNFQTVLAADKQLNQTQTHTYALEVPEGMTLNEAQRAIFEEQANEMGLDDTVAQKLLEFAFQNQQSNRKAYIEQVIAWEKEVRGQSDSANLIAYAQAGLARFDPERKLFEILEETGYANHPTVIRFLAEIGKAHAEDGILLGKASTAQTPRHERLYGKYNNQQ